MRTVLAGVLLCFSFVSLAESPKAVISGPTGGVPGDIILLDASNSVGDYFKWAVSRELPDGRQTLVVVSESGKKAVLASLPGQHEVWLAVGNKDGIDLLKYVVTISGSGPTPNPSPNPQPNPNPDVGPKFPDSRLGISQRVYDVAKTVPRASGESQDLAKQFRGVVAQIAAKTITGSTAIIGAIRDANSSALNTEEKRGRWTPFLDKNGPLTQILKEQKPSTDAQFSEVFNEFAAGLEAIK